MKERDGYACLKICAAEATHEAMLRELERIVGASRTVTFGSGPDRYDVQLEHADRDWMVKELKRRFEPVDLRGWRNMFKLR